MGQPIWQVRNSNLGTIAENIFFEYELKAIDTDLDVVTYSHIAGDLPEGIYISGTQIAGFPIKIVGTPAEVDVDTSSLFTIRATTTTNEVSDVTFSLQVSGQRIPHIITPSGQLDEFYYGEYVDIQLDAIDEDDANVLTWSVSGAVLPEGLFLVQDPDNDRIAYIRGYPFPVSALPAGTDLGFDGSKFDEDIGEFGFDYGLGTLDKNYQFTISTTDGIGYDAKTFSIFLKSTYNLSADNTDITADDTTITADRSTGINPIVTTPEGDLGTYLHDNYFAFQFEGYDFESNAIEFSNPGGGLPPSLALDAESGYIHGFLDVIVDAEEVFTFDIITYKIIDPTISSNVSTFTMTITGDLSTALTFTNPTIMCLDNGSVSELFIEAVPTFETAMTYTLVGGRLPPGLTLTPEGLIIGRPRFDYFKLDGGATTIDGGPGPDTSCSNLGGSFDNTFIFDVRVVDVTAVIDTEMEFTIIVAPVNNEPYESLTLVSYLPVQDRIYFNQLTDQPALVPREDVYRLDDENFGIAADVRFKLVNGLNPSSRTSYAAAMTQNHYTRKFGFDELRIAEALDANGDLIYEVIYSDVTDFLEEGDVSIGQELVLNNVSAAEVIAQGGIPTYNSDGQLIGYPASLTNMRLRILDQIGQTSVSDNLLPKWMTSPQPDGRTLGFITAVPLVYCKPGTAQQILFNIIDYGWDIKTLGFEVDRYVWDNSLSDLDDAPATTFDNDMMTLDNDETTFGSTLGQVVITEELLKFPKTNIFS